MTTHPRINPVWRFLLILFVAFLVSPSNALENWTTGVDVDATIDTAFVTGPGLNSSPLFLYADGGGYITATMHCWPHYEGYQAEVFSDDELFQVQWAWDWELRVLDSTDDYVLADLNDHPDFWIEFYDSLGNPTNASNAVSASWGGITKPGRYILRFYGAVSWHPDRGTNDVYGGWSDPGEADVYFDVGGARLHAELDGVDMSSAPNDADDAIKLSIGAVVALNNNDDDRDGTVDVDDGKGHSGNAGAVDEKDLKKVILDATFPGNSGTVVLRRGSDRVRVYKDPKKGDGADWDKKLLWTDRATGTYAAETEGNGKKSWDLSDAGQRTDFYSIVSSGVWVEGTKASSSKRDTSISLSYIPAGDSVARSVDYLYFTVIDISMDFAKGAADINTYLGADLDPSGAVNQIPNPGVVVIESGPTANNAAILSLATPQAFLKTTADDDFIEWKIVGDGGTADFYSSDNKGVVSRLYGQTAGKIKVEIRPKAAVNPYFTYYPAVVSLNTIKYRSNFLSNAGVTPARIPTLVDGLANIMLRQAGIKLIPEDTYKTAGEVPNANIQAPGATAGTKNVPIASPDSKFVKDAKLKIDDGANSESVEVASVDKVNGKIVLKANLAHNHAAGVNVKWEFTVADTAGDVAGCRSVTGLGFVNVDADNRFYLAMINSANDVLNFAFVGQDNSALGLAGEQVFTPSNSKSNPAGAATQDIAGRIHENGETYTLSIFKAPWGPDGTGTYPNIGTKSYGGILIFTQMTARGYSDSEIAAAMVHEILHACALRHRIANPSDDKVVVSESLPFVTGGASSHAQNVMEPNSLDGMDVDRVQAEVANSVGL